MLKRLKISNFAIIENVELRFENQLTVITGETGSGKSILLGALNLLLGERADYSVIRDNTGKTIVEGVWKINEDLRIFFEENDLDFEEECIIRREVLKEGKSRAFINDTPVNLNLLKDLTRRLVHIHSQHNTLELRDKLFQLSILDVLGTHQDILHLYQKTYQTYLLENKQLQKLKNDLFQARKDQDYINFQIEELEILKLSEIDYTAIKERLEELEQGEQIIENASQSLAILDQNDGLLPLINRLKLTTSKISTKSKSLQKLASRVQSTEIELRDIHLELEHFVESFEFNTKEIDHLNERLESFNNSLRKHQLESQEQLLQLYHSYLNQNSSTQDLEDQMNQSQKKADEHYKLLLDQSVKITEQRKITSKQISKQLIPYFDRLKLKDAQVGFHFTQKPNLDFYGQDQVDFLFSTNAGIAPQPIEKVASGGELGRLMLILMTLLSERKSLPTIIFDEIDTGVSGEVADRIGQLLREMGRNRQLLTITHLPQVASAGNHHLAVRKSSHGNKTVSEVVALSFEERKIEIAKLLSGEELSAAAMDNAKSLLSQHD
jgi:DNA repair protein RecN (Recombination protein N)